MVSPQDSVPPGWGLTDTPAYPYCDVLLHAAHTHAGIDTAPTAPTARVQHATILAQNPARSSSQRRRGAAGLTHAPITRRRRAALSRGTPRRSCHALTVRIRARSAARALYIAPLEWRAGPMRENSPGEKGEAWHGDPATARPPTDGRRTCKYVCTYMLRMYMYMSIHKCMRACVRECVRECVRT